MKERFSQEQITGFLREAEAGVAVKALCHKHGFSEASYSPWRGERHGGKLESLRRRLKNLVQCFVVLRLETRKATGNPARTKQPAPGKSRLSVSSRQQATRAGAAPSASHA